MQSTVGIVGIGSMGLALVRGLQETPDRYSLYLVDAHEHRLEAAGSKCVTLKSSSVCDIPKNLDVLILAVKPHDLNAVSVPIAENISRTTLVISLLAGTQLAHLSTCIHANQPIVRSMPNIAATIGMAATAMSANSHTTDLQKTLAEQVFRSVGEVHWVKELMLDAVTALSGSGPAYVYLMLEAMIEGGVKVGLPRNLAQALALQTLIGSGQLLKSSGEHPAILRERVVTPGGTTIAALHVLESAGLRATFMSAIEAATERGRLLQSR